MSAQTIDTPDVIPPPPVEDDGDGERPGVYVSASVTVFGLHRASQAYFPEKPDDVALATELYNTMAAVAHMQGAGVWFELQRKFANCG